MMKKALLLGVKGPGIEEIVKSDNEEIKNSLESYDSEISITYLSDGLDRNTFKNAIEDWVESLNSNDKGVLYITSHAAKTDSNAYLKLENYQNDNNQKLNELEFRNIITEINPDSKVEIILDFCYSKSFWDDSLNREGLNFWASSGSNEKSYSDAGNMSLFTACLCDYHTDAPNRAILLEAINSTLNGKDQTAYFFGSTSSKFLQ